MMYCQASLHKACNIFQFPIKHASKDIKAILGEGSQFPKTRITLSSKAVNVLQTEDGIELIAVPQVCSIFQFLKKHTSKDIKAILSNDSPFLKTRTTLNSKAVNVLHC